MSLAVMATFNVFSTPRRFDVDEGLLDRFDGAMSAED
jgi:hypothetical protein